jgi:Flp pilus assembly protein TadD
MSRPGSEHKHRHSASNAAAGRTSPLAAPSRPADSRRLLRWVILLAVVAAAATGAWVFWGPSAKHRGAGRPLSSARREGVESQPALNRNAPTNRSSDKALTEKVNRANELLARGKTDDAIAALNEALLASPNDEDVHYNLGIAFSRKGNTDEAIKHYEEALRVFPDYLEVHNNLGNLLARLGRLDEAAKHFIAAAKAMPDYAPAYNNLGHVRQRQGQTNEARAQFQKAVELKPDYWEAHFNLGSSYAAASQFAQARQEFETVLKLQPAFQPAQAALARLNGVAPAP